MPTNVIRLKRSSVEGKAPTSLEEGELALNLADELLYVKNAAGAIVPINDFSSVASATTLEELTDTDLTTVAPQVGEGLVWDGAKWSPGVVSSTSETVEIDSPELNVATPTATFNVAHDEGKVEVYLNGIRLQRGIEYTSDPVAGTVTLLEGAIENDWFAATGFKGVVNENSGTVTLTIVAFDPSNSGAGFTFSNENKTAQRSGSSGWQTSNTDALWTTGKHYLEWTIDNTGSQNQMAGVGSSALNPAGTYSGTEDAMFYFKTSEVYRGTTGGGASGLPSVATGDVLMMFYDIEAQSIWFGINGTWDGDPVAGTGPLVTSFPLPAGGAQPKFSANDTAAQVTINSPNIYPNPAA